MFTHRKKLLPIIQIILLLTLLYLTHENPSDDEKKKNPQKNKDKQKRGKQPYESATQNPKGIETDDSSSSEQQREGRHHPVLAKLTKGKKVFRGMMRKLSGSMQNLNNFRQQGQSSQQTTGHPHGKKDGHQQKHGRWQVGENKGITKKQISGPIGPITHLGLQWLAQQTSGQQPQPTPQPQPTLQQQPPQFKPPPPRTTQPRQKTDKYPGKSKEPKALPKALPKLALNYYKRPAPQPPGRFHPTTTSAREHYKPLGELPQPRVQVSQNQARVPPVKPRRRHIYGEPLQSQLPGPIPAPRRIKNIMVSQNHQTGKQDSQIEQQVNQREQRANKKHEHEKDGQNQQ